MAGVHGHLLANLSELQKERALYQLPIPKVLEAEHSLVDGDPRSSVGNFEEIRGIFPNLTAKPLHLACVKPGGTPSPTTPLRVGVVLSGGQASGGHNVIAGIFDYIQKWAPGSQFFGFLNGPGGILKNQYREITAAELAAFRNQGGFHLIGSGRDKIEKPEQLAAAAQAANALQLDGLVIIGGDDSNTNAAVLAEHFAATGTATRVIGVPKTIDGDLKNADVPISFGFDTACKVYSEVIGNIMLDGVSAKKYWHFVRLMGRSASHVTLECALQTHPQVALISEEVQAKGYGLKDVAKQVADAVAARAAAGKNYGVVLLPEGLVEFLGDVCKLIEELNDLLASGADGRNHAAISATLSAESRAVFELLPSSFRAQLLGERDPHGNVQVSAIETEKLLVQLVEAELAERKAAGTYSGKFATTTHFFGYEGRCSLPSNFDATYCYCLGQAAGALTRSGRSGLMSTITGLNKTVEEWGVGGTPLVSMMHLERRAGKLKPVIAKALVELDGPAFQYLAAHRAEWGLEDCFRQPGPIQFKGDAAQVANITLALEINKGEPIVLKH